MIRKFALVTFNNADEVVDRFVLDLVSEPQGLGFILGIETVKAGAEDIVTEIKQEFQSITLNQNYAFGREYERVRALRLWIMRNTFNRMALEWETPVDKLYAMCKIESFSFTEINQSRILSVPLVLKPTSPFFEVIRDIVQIYPLSTAKDYPYDYIYEYGSSYVENNAIQNDYIAPIPLIVKVFGQMTSPHITISDASAGEVYARVSFPDISLSAGQYITINAVDKKITFYDGSHEWDGYNYLNFSLQSFILAKENSTSFLSANITPDKSGYMEASYRRYRL